MADVSGFMVGFIPLGLLGAILMILSAGFDNDIMAIWGWSLFLTGVALGFLLALVFWFFRRKYIVCVDDYRADFKNRYPEDYKADRLLLLQVVNDKVVDSGKAVWGKDKKSVHAILLPRAEHDSFKLTVPLQSEKPSVRIMLFVALSGDFVPQELYDEIILKGYDSLKTWLAEAFQRDALSTRQIQACIKEYAKCSIFLFADAVDKNLHWVRLVSSRRLSNITAIRATAVVEEDQVLGNIYSLSKSIDSWD